MVQPQRGFTLVDDLPEQSPEHPQQSQDRIDIPSDFLVPPAPKKPRIDAVSAEMLRMSLHALSQRAAIALSQLLATTFILLTVGSVFVLWYLTPDPTQTQIASLTIYAGFILAINYLNMRRRG